MVHLLKTSKENKDLIASWKRFGNTQKWKAIQRVLQKFIDDADKLTNILGTDKEVEFTKRDLAILKKQICQQIQQYPDTIISTLSGSGILKTPNLDPFANMFDEDLLDELAEE